MSLVQFRPEAPNTKKDFGENPKSFFVFIFARMFAFGFVSAEKCVDLSDMPRESRLRIFWRSASFSGEKTTAYLGMVAS